MRIARSEATSKARRLSLLAAVALGISLGLHAPVHAQNYPGKVVRFVVPAPPGGPTDSLARVIGDKLTGIWQQQVVIDNRPGANSTLGTNVVARAAPDGYTLLLLLDATVTMLPAAMKNLSYDPRQLTPIMTLVNVPGVLAASSASPARTLPDVIRLAKADPGKLSIGFGVFSMQVAAAQLVSQADVKMIAVPYKGGPDVAQGLMAGDLTLGLGPSANFKQGSRLRIMATTGTARSASAPDVPTFGELGYPGFETGTWIGLAAPTGTPQNIIDKVYADVNAVMNMPEVQEKLRLLDMELYMKNPAESARMIKEDTEKWGKVIREAGLTLE